MARRHFRKLQRLAGSAQFARRLLVAISVMAMFAVASEALAQVNPPSRLMFSSWIKFCNTRPDSGPKRCATTKDVYEGGQMVASVAVDETENSIRRFVRLTTTDGFSLRPGARLAIDDGPLLGASVCMPTAKPSRLCAMHYYPIEADVISLLKNGQFLTVQAVQTSGQPMRMQIDLKGFAGAYDGSPADIKALADWQMRSQSVPNKPIRDDRLQPRIFEKTN